MFLGSVQEFCRKVPGKLRENCWKNFPESRNATILGFREPGKANLPETLGPHCRDLVPTFRAGCFFEIDSSSLLEFFFWNNEIVFLSKHSCAFHKNQPSKPITLKAARRANHKEGASLSLGKRAGDSSTQSNEIGPRPHPPPPAAYWLASLDPHRQRFGIIAGARIAGKTATRARIAGISYRSISNDMP